MLSAMMRKEAREIWKGASDYHRKWIQGLVEAADRGDEISEEMLVQFIKARRRVSSKAAYAQVMDTRAQTTIEDA